MNLPNPYTEAKQQIEQYQKDLTEIVNNLTPSPDKSDLNYFIDIAQEAEKITNPLCSLNIHYTPIHQGINYISLHLVAEQYTKEAPYKAYTYNEITQEKTPFAELQQSIIAQLEDHLQLIIEKVSFSEETLKMRQEAVPSFYLEYLKIQTNKRQSKNSKKQQRKQLSRKFMAHQRSITVKRKKVV